jgi:aminodeoxyfutalosine synthase
MAVSDAELATLADSYDIIALGMKADDVRRSRHGARTTYVRVFDVPCAGDMPAAIPSGAGEVRIVGAPGSRAAAVQRIREVVAIAGTRPVTGFSLADLEALAGREQVTLRALLEEMRAAGLELVSHAPFDRLQDPRRSIEEVNIAGLSLGRLTIDRLSADDDMPALFRRVTALQDAVAVIRAFAPLPRTINPAMPTTGFEDVKRVALARLFVTNIPSIQVDWSLYGPKLAQVALTVGADDVDAVSAVDDMSEGRRRSPVEEIQRNIRAAGLEPVPRDGRFERIAR